MAVHLYLIHTRSHSFRLLIQIVCHRYDSITRKNEDVKKVLGFRTERFVVGGIQPPHVTDPIYVTCLHLNHVAEPTRLNELSFIADRALARLLPRSGQQCTDDTPAVSGGRRCHNFAKPSWPMQIWTGDFNALTKEDYPTSLWEEVANVRALNRWEAPVTQLTTKVVLYAGKSVKISLKIEHIYLLT